MLFGKIKQLLVKLLAQHVILPKEKEPKVTILLVKISAINQVKELPMLQMENVIAHLPNPVKLRQMQRKINVTTFAIITLNLKLMVQLVNAKLVTTLHLTMLINLPHAIKHVIQQEEPSKVTNVNVKVITLEKNVILNVNGLK